MKKLIINKHTLKLAERQMLLAYQEAYIAIMRVLEKMKKWDNADLEYIESQKKETTDLFNKVMEKYKK